MPDLTSRLSAAADGLTPSPRPPFPLVERRFRRRRARRAVGLLGVLVLAAGGVVGLGSLSSGGSRHVVPAAPQPCVQRTEQNARDVFAVLPHSGTAHLDLPVGSTVTVGWVSCSETGDVTVPDNPPKMPLLVPPGGRSRVDTLGVASARFQAFRVGTVVVNGQGSEGSAGALSITIVPFVEPVGASEPSPFPNSDLNEGVPPLCLTPGAADANGRVTQTVSFSTATLAPAPGVTSRFSAADILERFRSDPMTRGSSGGHPNAYFGRLTDDDTNPFPKSRPLWVVVVCDEPLYPGSGSGGALLLPTPAPGTSPSPGGSYIGLTVVPFDESGHPLVDEYTSYPDAALRSELFFEVPFDRNNQDAMEGRQIGLTYRSDDSCSTFDHLRVSEPINGGDVYVQVWLRLTGHHDRCPKATDAHDVVVGLRTPLGERALVRGVPPR